MSSHGLEIHQCGISQRQYLFSESVEGISDTEWRIERHWWQDGGRCSVAVRAPVRNMKSKHLHLLATWRHTPEVNLRFHCSFFLVDDSFHSRSWFDAIRFVIAYTVNLRALAFVWANIYYTFQVFIGRQVVETMTVLLSQWLSTSNFSLFLMILPLFIMFSLAILNIKCIESSIS